MKDRTKEQLLNEIKKLHHKITGLEASETQLKQTVKTSLLDDKSHTEAILAAIGDGISIQAVNYRILYQNQMHKDLVGDHVGEFCYAAYRQREAICEECPIAISFKDGRIHKAERSLITDKGMLHMAVTASALRNSKGEIIAGIEVIRDITKRKTAEASLKESERKYRALVDNTLVGVYKTNLKGDILFVNAALSRILEFASPEEMIKEKTTALYKNPERREELIESIRKTGKVKNFEAELLTKTGKSKHVLLSAVLDGDILSGMIMDISDRKLSEEGIKESEEKYRMLIENIQDGIFIIQDAKIKFLNEAFAKMIGYTVEEVIGMDIQKLIAPEDLDMVMDRYQQRLAGKDVPKEYEFLMLHKDGVTRVIVNMLVGLVDYQGRTANMGTVKDVTEHKLMEAELQKAQKLESLGILAGGIAHDFNNILTAITGNISLAKMYAQPGLEVFDILTEVEKASLRAKNLTTQLLTFSKGGIPVKRLSSITKLIKDSTGFALSGSKVKCEISTPDDLCPVEIDEGQISQVIHHMIINAQQAMPEGGIIKVKAENITTDAEQPLPLKGGKYLKISIKDHGIGISEEHLAKIFDPYFTTKQKGSGLGLASAYSIIKKHEGHITAESKLGEGTTFYIYLPASEKKIPMVKDTVASPAGRGKGKVLVMDDDDTVRLVVGRMLGQCGYEAEFAEDGEGAIELYKKAKESGAPFDAVIIDLIIPAGMGGKEAIKKLIEIDPAIRAIVSSGYSDDPVMSNFKEYGFKDAMAKPYEIADLRQMLHKVIAGI
ncbi:MAG: PAS domain S-box protein [Thermodesulfovibrionales bacterium]|nr:PAS domain S-box protein [Thermodesulfovibrionales bacterium]